MNLKGILKGILCAYIITAVFVLVGAVLTYFNMLDERKISIGIYAGAALGVFLGAFGAAKTSESRILLNSLCVSLIFIAVLLAASFIINGGVALGARTVSVMGGALAAGFMGAVIGK